MQEADIVLQDQPYKEATSVHSTEPGTHIMSDVDNMQYVKIQGSDSDYHPRMLKNNFHQIEAY